MGGAERFGADLACALKGITWDPILCAFWRRNVFPERHWVEYLTKKDVEVFFAADWPGQFSISHYAKGIGNIVSYIQGRPIDVIHSNFQVGSLSALLLKKKLKAKAIIRTAHLSPNREWGTSLSGMICRQIFTKWIFPIFYDTEVGVSQAIMASLDQRLASQLVGRHASFIPNGINPNKFQMTTGRSAKRLEFGLSNDELVVGSVGRLTNQKGYSFLIDAAYYVTKRLPNTKFIIVGDGDQEFRLHNQAEILNISDKIIFAGPRQDIESLYKIMDLFVLPSLWEGLPTVILESMASGVPVIATDIPGTRELVTDGYTGRLVKPKDPLALAEAIIDTLLNPSKRTEFACRALETVVPKYSMEYVASQYKALYAHLADSR
ncbi:MAG: glycosyltransferase family 4 protein [Candidatus Hadarchaeum sp.]